MPILIPNHPFVRNIFSLRLHPSEMRYIRLWNGGFETDWRYAQV
jgi:hypothetical protein